MTVMTMGFAGANVNAAPIPTADQLNWHEHEIMALVHFNMATFFEDGDPGCTAENWVGSGGSSDPASFNPSALSTDDWAESMVELGAKHAVITAKHGCGHLLWPTDVTLPDGSPYQYSVGVENVSSYSGNLLEEFVDSMRRAGIGHGFYYSLTNNFYLNVQGHFVQNSTLLPGQVKVTQDEFEAIALGHVTELWTRFGNLTEIWFDGGYTSDMEVAITELLQEHQPHAVAFGGHGVTKNQVRWVGTESGLPDYPIWSTGLDGGGDPESTQWQPAGCDTTLQQGDHWFYEPQVGIRSLEELIDVYHATVGANGVLELDYAIDRTGRVDPAHKARYKELGEWIRSCYGSPVVQITPAISAVNASVEVAVGAMIDRVILREDQSMGQRVRGYVVEVMAKGSSEWAVMAEGSSVGNKRIQLGSSVVADRARLTVTEATDTPLLATFALFAPCPSE